jgi:hypothetical protein
MALLAYNLTTSPVTLSGLTTILPASATTAVEGAARDVTGKLRGLSAGAYTSLESQRPSTVVYRWTALPEYATGTLETISAKRIQWTGVTFQNSYANVGAPFANAGYAKDAHGFIHLRGVVAGGTPGAVIFTLPAGYRPAHLIRIIAPIDDIPGNPDMLRINTDGTVQCESGGDSGVTLDNIHFWVG